MSSSQAATPVPSTAPIPPKLGPTPAELELAAWQRLRTYLQERPLTPETAPTIPDSTPPQLVGPIQAAHQAGLRTAMNTAGSVTSLNMYGIVGINTGSISFCQWQYYQQGFQYGINQCFAVMRAGQTNQPPVERSSTAPKLNPPKPFTGERSEFNNLIMQLNLIFNSDPARYTTDAARISYAASYLSGSAQKWFLPHVDQITAAVSFATWAVFVSELKAAFDDPDAYKTAQEKSKPFDKVLEIAVPIMQNLSLLSLFYALTIGP